MGKEIKHPLYISKLPPKKLKIKQTRPPIKSQAVFQVCVRKSINEIGGNQLVAAYQKNQNYEERNQRKWRGYYVEVFFNDRSEQTEGFVLKLVFSFGLDLKKKKKKKKN